MQNTDETIRFNKTVQIIQRYGQSLSNLKAGYHENFINSDFLSPQEDRSLNAVFILDFMIDRNRHIMKYLSCLQRHNQGISAISALLNINIDGTDINILVQNIAAKIETDGTQVTEPIIAYYHSINQFNAKCVVALFFSGIALTALGLGLIFGLNLAWATAIGHACFTIGASLTFGVDIYSKFIDRYVGKISQESITELVELTQNPEIELFKLMHDGHASDPTILATLPEFKYSYTKNFSTLPAQNIDTAKENMSSDANIKTTRSATFNKRASKTTLTDSFFSQCVSDRSLKISEDTQREYQQITASI